MEIRTSLRRDYRFVGSETWQQEVAIGRGARDGPGKENARLLPGVHWRWVFNMAASCHREIGLRAYSESAPLQRPSGPPVSTWCSLPTW